jgi:hypothetical protein
MNSVAGIAGAAIGVMCAAPPHEILLAIRSCGAYAILVDPSGFIRGTRKRLEAAALVIDVDDPGCDQALDTAAAAGIPVLAWAVRSPPDARREHLQSLNIPLLVGVDADTVCRELAATIARARGGGRADA